MAVYPRVHEIWGYIQLKEETPPPDDETDGRHQALRPSLAVTQAEGKPTYRGAGLRQPSNR